MTAAHDNVVIPPAPIPRRELAAVLSGSEAALRARSAAQEIVRAVLVLVALGLVCATVYLAYAASQRGHWVAARQWLDVALPAEMGIAGSALGFYFGSHRRPGG